MAHIENYIYDIMYNSLHKFELDIVNNYITISTHYISEDSFFDNDDIKNKNELMRMLTTGLENKLYDNVMTELRENLQNNNLYYMIDLLEDPWLPAQFEKRLKNLSVNKCNEIGEKVYDKYIDLEAEEARNYLNVLIIEAESDI